MGFVADVAPLPDEVHRLTDAVDDHRFAIRDIRIALRIGKAGDRLVFDVDGTEAPVSGNLTLNAT